MLGHEISYHINFGEPLYIQFLLTDMVSNEKESNVHMLDVIATWWLPILLQYNGALVVLVNNVFNDLLSSIFCKVPCLEYR